MKPLTSTMPSLVSKDLLQRYLRVVPVQGRSEEWNRQERYKGAFVQMKCPLGEDVRAMLEHGPWLACAAPRDGMTDRIGFDLDCSGEFDCRRRDALYWCIRRLFGLERIPLVYGTPSGHGLRVYYAIPRIELARLVSGRDAGLVADVLRAASLPIRAGILEIFPQKSQVDRLPLGRRMPLLDPATLLPIAGADIGDTFDVQMLEGALGLMERWLNEPCLDLVAHLESLPRVARSLILLPRGDDQLQHGFVQTANGVGPSRGLRRLVRVGLEGPHSRYDAEWLAAITMVLDPTLFVDLGLTDVRDDEQVAGTLARWVAERENGFSAEWADTVREHRSADAARQAWAQRYLARGSATGAHMVDRVRRAVAGLDGSMRRTFLLSAEERRGLMAIAEEAGRTGSSLFRAEVWLASCQRAVKSIVEHREQRGLFVQERFRDGQRTVVIPISARWMESWQFGKGRYTEYRELLEDSGRMRVARFSPTADLFRRGSRPPDDLAYEASEYEVRLPAMDLLVRDVGVNPLSLKLAIAEMHPTMSGRLLTIDTAHHILWTCRTGEPLRERYGRRLACTIEEIGAGLEARLAAQCGRMETHRFGTGPLAISADRAAA